MTAGEDLPTERLEWRTATVSGRPAAYGTAGTGPPLIFLHGWAVTNRTYAGALERLRRVGTRVLAPALPGFGGTAPLPADQTTVEGYAAWVDAFLTAVGCREPVVMIGHSFGGGVAIQTAHDFPERVRALVLVNSIGGSAWTRNGSIVKTMRDRPLWDWGLHFPRDVWPLGQVRKVLPVIVRDMVTNALRNPATFRRVADIARFADLTHELRELRERRLPVVVLWGEQDRIVTRASIDALVDAVGTENVVTLPGSHSWLLAEPEAFGEMMTNVLSVAERAKAARSRHPLLARLLRHRAR